MVECDTVIYMQQSVPYVRVWYSDLYVTIFSAQYVRVWQSDLYVTKCTVCESVIQWSICSKVHSMLEFDTVIYI